MTKKGHQQFWRIKKNFFGEENSIGNFFPRPFVTCCSEIGEECFIDSEGWTPLPKWLNVNAGVIADRNKYTSKILGQYVFQCRNSPFYTFERRRCFYFLSLLFQTSPFPSPPPPPSPQSPFPLPFP